MTDLPDDAPARPDLDDLPDLSNQEIRRYGRHLVLPEVGVEGQRRLKAGRVLLVGAGGLGSPAALYLAAAGVGTLGIVEFDTVDETNLQRQVLYGTSDVGAPKLATAIARLRDINPHVEIVPHAERLDIGNVLRLVEGYDLVLDGSDNFPTRYLVNDACVIAKKPLVWGAVLRFEGQVSVFGVDGGPCYRCLFPEPPPPGSVPSCAEGGVFGVLPGVIGGLQATEAIKLLVGRGESLVGRFLVYDALTLRFRELRLPKNPACPTCGENASPELVAYDDACDPIEIDERETETMTPTDPSESRPPEDSVPFEIDVEQLQAWREEGREHVLLDVREPHEFEICRIDGADLVPMRTVPARLDELDREALIVAQCHHGGRSAQVVQYLRAQGFARATNLAGGIDAWSARIDPSVPRY